MSKLYQNTALLQSAVVPKHFNLTADDLSQLDACFITPEIAKSAKLRRVTDEQGAEIVGQKRNAGRCFSGIVYPYFSPPNYEAAVNYDLRRDQLDVVMENGVEKTTGKYLKAPGSRSALYFPPNVTPEMLADMTLPIFCFEGAKKALAAYRLSTHGLRDGERWRFLPISISGVNNFITRTGKTTRPNGTKADVKGLLPAFDSLELRHRQFVIVFDANVRTKPQIRAARFAFADRLRTEKAALVHFVDLPLIDGVNGIDDLLALWERESDTTAAIKKGLDLFDLKYLFNGEIATPILNGKLTLEIQPADRAKSKITAKDADGTIIAKDVLNLSESAKRAVFVKGINQAFNLSNDEKTALSSELLKLSEIGEQIAVTDTQTTPTGEVVETAFQELKDGRLIEQIRDGFGVFDPTSGEHSIAESVTDSDGITYVPIDDELFQKSGGIQIADNLAEYGSTVELIAEIEIYLARYLDLKPLQLKLSALYVLFTYIADTVLELSYLNATGDPGSGKSRFGQTVCFASRFGLALITPSAASLYRIVDRFKPTLFLDEFNSNANADDAAAVIQVLNAGFQKTAQVPRQVQSADGKFKTELFSAFCPKIIGSLKQSDSNAFNSRCIEIQMERTTRNDIPLRLSNHLLRDAQALRNKLTLWRLRNIKNDFEARLDQAEVELRKVGIIPRSIQINIPLFALMDDDRTKTDFIELLKGRDKTLIAEKQSSFDGEIVRMLYNSLFIADAEDDGADLVVTWRETRPLESKPSESLRIEKLKAMLNDSRKERDHVEERYLGKKINALGLRTMQIMSRSSDYRKKSAVVFDSRRLAYLFHSYGMAVPPDFSLGQLGQNDKSISDNDLDWPNEKNTDNLSKPRLGQLNPNDCNNNSHWPNWPDEKSEIIDVNEEM